MEVIECVQGSEEWWEARLGYVTASNFHKVLNKRTGRGLYMRKIAAEKLTGCWEESYKNEIMEYGSETEQAARLFYEQANDCTIEQIGFVKRDDWIGGSPDGFIGKAGIIEIKCPLASTHIENILSGKMPTLHIPQVQGLLWITERKWCDFVSFDPKVVSKPMFCIRVELDTEYFKKLAGEVGVFVNELKEMINKIDDKSF